MNECGNIAVNQLIVGDMNSVDISHLSGWLPQGKQQVPSALCTHPD